MATATLPAPATAGNPPAQNLVPAPTQAPAKPRRPAATLDDLVARWIRTARADVAQTLELGRAAQRLILRSLRGTDNRGDRRHRRAEVVREIEKRLATAGLAGDRARVDVVIRAAATLALLKAEDTAPPPAWRKLRALSALVRRDPRTDAWRLAADPARLDDARELYARATAGRLGPDVIRAEVRRFLGRKPAAKKPRADLLGQVRRYLGEVTSLSAALTLREALEARIAALSPPTAAAA